MSEYLSRLHSSTRWQLYGRFALDCIAAIYLLALLNRQADKDWLWIPALAGIAMICAGVAYPKFYGRIYEWSSVAGLLILVGYLTLAFDHYGFIFLGLTFLALAIDIALDIALAFRLVRPSAQSEQPPKSLP